MYEEHRPVRNAAVRLAGWLARNPIVLLVVAAPGLLVGWLVVDVKRTWSRLDRAAGRLAVPDGFRRVGSVRQGTAFCFVTCTNGGEAIVTVVLDGGDQPVDVACDRIRRAVGAVPTDVRAATDPETTEDPTTTRAPDDPFECSPSGSLGGTASACGAVMRRSDLRPLGPAQLYGPRWTEKLPIPAGPLLAWIEFYSGIE